MAIAHLMQEACSGKPLEQVAGISNEIVLDIFGKDISMGKGQGLMGIVNMVVHEAKRRL